MSGKKDNERIEAYVSQVCSRIRASRRRREDIAMELKSHLADLVEAEQEGNEDNRDTALQRALARMGDPDELGRRLRHVHKPPFDWVLLLGALIFAVIGLLLIWGIQLSHPRFGDFLLTRKATAVAIGSVVMLLLCFTDYRILARYAHYVYAGGFILLICTRLSGLQVMGQTAYLSVFGVNIGTVQAAPYLFAFAFAGILGTKRGLTGNKRLLAALLLAPALLILTSRSMMTFMQYALVCLIILAVARLSWKVIGTVAAACFFILAFYLLPLHGTSYDRWERMTSFLHPHRDPNDSGYYTIQALEAIRKGGWFGQGFGIEIRTLPSIQSDMAFPYLTYSFGWLAALLLIVVIAAFVIRGIRLSASVRETTGKLLASGLIGLLAFQFGWHILMSFGLLPVMGVSLPFISYGTTSAVMQMAAVGLLFSIRRHRSDLIFGKETAETAS